MNITDKIKLFFMTIVIDILLYTIILSQIDFYNLIFVYSIFITHFIFIISLLYDLNLVLKIIHHIIFLYPILCFFINNLYLKLLSLSLLLVIQLLWIIEGRCILSERENEFGYGELTTYVVRLLTLFLIRNILQFINI